MKLLAYNALAISFIGACAIFVMTGHPYFGIACFVMAALNSHTFGKEG